MIFWDITIMVVSPSFFYFLKENSYAIVLAKLSFSSRRERSQIENLMRGDWGYAPTSEYDGAFMRSCTPLATLLTTVRTRLSLGSARRNVGRDFWYNGEANISRTKRRLMMRIGIVSDTHGLLRKEVVEGLRGVDHIIHAGDIDKKEVLDELEKIAPVTAVRGNADKDWAVYLPEKALLEFEGNKIYVIHGIFESL